MKTSYKLLWMSAGTLLIICGIVCLCNINNMDAVPIILGVFLLVTSFLDIGLFFVSYHYLLATRLVIIEGILSFILGLILLIFQKGAFNFIFVLFGIYILLMGLSKLLKAYEFKKFQMEKFQIPLIEGIVLIVIAILCFVLPSFVANASIFITSIYLIVLGASDINDCIQEIEYEKKHEQKKAIKDDKKVVEATIIEKDEEKK